MEVRYRELVPIEKIGLACSSDYTYSLYSEKEKVDGNTKYYTLVRHNRQLGIIVKTTISIEMYNKLIQDTQMAQEFRGMLLEQFAVMEARLINSKK